MEEEFFFMYHLHMPPSETLMMPVNERKWYVHRFIQQKEKENEAMEKARKQR
jgi:hypothetical protein